ncbi:MAG: ribonuclease III [Treponema sp.]|nr:ribonuclease III [Treponema sp.]
MKINNLNKDRISSLTAFCKAQKITFSDVTLLDQAFHHRSLTNEQKNAKNNERLEFLGDSVLGMVTASYLYRTLENPEGDLAKIKSAVVSEKALAPIALSMGVDKLLVMGHGEEMSGGRTKPAILADCMEAIIGAYYLDSGYKKAESFVLSFIKNEIHKVCTYGMKDFKTQLQEKFQKTHRSYPVYQVVDRNGPEHDQIFSVTVTLGNQVFGPAKGKNKKDAEQAAAKIALDSYKF